MPTQTYLTARHKSVLKHFPGALGVDDFMARVEVALCGYGFTGANSIAMTNLCRCAAPCCSCLVELYRLAAATHHVLAKHCPSSHRHDQPVPLRSAVRLLVVSFGCCNAQESAKQCPYKHSDAWQLQRQRLSPAELLCIAVARSGHHMLASYTTEAKVIGPPWAPTSLVALRHQPLHHACFHRSDEVTTILKDKIEAVFGSSFNTNGLGAVLTCGVTGVKAGISHSPIDPESGRERCVWHALRISLHSGALLFG